MRCSSSRFLQITVCAGGLSKPHIFHPLLGDGSGDMTRIQRLRALETVPRCQG